MRASHPGLALPLLVAAACATSAPSQTPLMSEGAAVSAAALRIRMRALAPPLIASVELTADEIRTSSTDPVIQRRAIVWKLNTSSALYRQLFAEFPMAGLLDCWAMLIQAEQYFAKAESLNAVGAVRDQVLAEVKKMESRVEETFVWAAPSRDPRQVRAELAVWAGQHPVDGNLSTRRSIREDLAARTAGTELSAFASVGAAAEDLQGLIDRVDFLPTLVPKQSIWEAELAYQDFGSAQVVQMMKRADLALGHVDDMLRWLGGPSLDGFADRQRQAMLAAVERERLALTALVETEQNALSTLADRERVALVEDLRRERIAATADVRQAATESIGRASLAAKDVIDHLVLRLALLFAGAILLWGGVAALLGRRSRAHHTSGPDARVDVGLPPP